MANKIYHGEALRFVDTFTPSEGDQSQPIHIYTDGWQVRFFRGQRANPDAQDFSDNDNENLTEATLDELHLSKQDELNVALKALYYKIPMGYDDRSQTKTAAAHIITDMRDKQNPRHRMYITVNADPRSATQRFCAEANGIAMLKGNVGVDQFKVTKTYITMDRKGPEGAHALPCGTCREELTNDRFINSNAVFVSVPYLPEKYGPGKEAQMDLVDRSDEVRADISADGEEGKAFAMEMSNLSPTYKIGMKRHGEYDGQHWQQVIRRGLDYMRDGELPKPLAVQKGSANEIRDILGRGDTARVPLLEDLGDGKNGYTLERVNKYLSNMIKNTCVEHQDALSQGKVHKIKAVLVVRADGRVYAGIHADVEGLSSRPLAESQALGNAYNKRDVKEVFVMEMDEEYIQKNFRSEEVPVLRTFFAEALHGLYNNRYSGDEQLRDISGKLHIRSDPDLKSKPTNESQCWLHILPLNDGQLEGKELEDAVLSRPIEQVYRNAYTASHALGP
ncbi:MAG: hypothetical protein MRY32_02380 [Rickettsiales bacterium]|nr:hypothetical protein [Rickettsiales bacterium]